MPRSAEVEAHTATARCDLIHVKTCSLSLFSAGMQFNTLFLKIMGAAESIWLKLQEKQWAGLAQTVKVTPHVDDVMFLTVAQF